jgi:hypothetical protein
MRDPCAFLGTDLSETAEQLSVADVVRRPYERVTGLAKSKQIR